MDQILLGTLIFFLVPVYIKKRQSSIALSTIALYFVEAIVLFFVWTVISVFFTFKDYPFNVSIILYYIIIGFGYVAIIIYAVLGKYHKTHKPSSFSCASKYLSATTFGIICYHIFRLTYFQAYEYRDNISYISAINDIIETNRFFLYNEISGKVILGHTNMSRKLALSAWYTFEAAISYISGLHPLIIVNTVLPPFIILFSYMSYWLLSELLFEKQYNKRLSFLLVIALLFQFLTEETSTLFLIWPTWGKNLVLSVLIPIYLYFYYTPDLKEKSRHVILVLTGFSACFISTMGVVLIPILIIGCKIHAIIEKKRIELKDIISTLTLLLPVLIYAVIFILW